MGLNLHLLEPIAHSLFGVRPLAESSRFRIDYHYRTSTRTLPRTNQISKRQVDNRGVDIHIPESGYVVPLIVRNIFTAKVALVLEKTYHDPKIVAVFQFPDMDVIELSTRVNLEGFSYAGAVSNRVWALTEADGQILWSYVNLEHLIACDGC